MRGQAVFDAERHLAIERSGESLPDTPLSVFGSLAFMASNIEQGGVVRAPLGLIQFGSNLDRAPGTVRLLPGSLTSVSGAELVMPYGGTTDGINYLVNQVPIQLTGAGGARCWDTDCGSRPLCQRGRCATGRAAGPVRRRRTRGGWIHLRQRGSTDARFHPLVQQDNDGFRLPELSSNPVYAIVPGHQAVSAPLGGEAGAIQPLVGQQVTIGDGVPGLAAGTYTLLPSTYALLPGAFRVEINGLAGQGAPMATQGLRNGSWATSGQLSIAGTSIRDSLSRQVILSSADTLRRYSQYNEMSYADFIRADAARKNIPRAMLPVDARSLYLGLRADEELRENALSFEGKVDFTPEESGYGGSLIVDAEAGIEILPEGGLPDSDFAGVSLVADDLNAIGASRIAIGTLPYVEYGEQGNFVQFGGSNRLFPVVLRKGAHLSAPEVIIGRDITLEGGSGISTLGKGKTAYDSSDGFIYQPGGRNLLLLSNGWLNLLAPAADSSLPVRLGGCAEGAGCADTELYSEGTLGIATNGTVTFGDNVRYGTRNLSLALSTINIGSSQSLADAAARGVLPNGGAGPDGAPAPAARRARGGYSGPGKPDSQRPRRGQHVR